MNSDEFHKVLDIYECDLQSKHPSVRRTPGWIKCNRVVHNDEKWGHALTMIPKMRVMLDDDNEGKFFRWLGFVQGVMWSTGLYSIDELRSHSRGICS